MSIRKRAAGMAASPELDTPDPVKKRKKNDVSNLVTAGVLDVLPTSRCVESRSASTNSDVQEHHECSPAAHD